nr:hypothetical protein Itr_chr14CG10690 [Ipomoea trifida]
MDCLVSRSLSSTSLAKAIASESNEGLSNANSAWIAGFSPETKQSNNASGFIRAGDGGMDEGVVLVGDWVEVDATTWVSWVIRTARSAIAVLMTTVRAWFCVAMARHRSSVVCCWDSRIYCIFVLLELVVKFGLLRWSWSLNESTKNVENGVWCLVFHF